MFLSIGGITVLYLAMQTSILGVVPWREAQASKFIVSTFVETLYGPLWGQVATAMILWVAFGSLFSLTLGYSRIPYAAALDGNFFAVFGRVHPTKNFPHVSLLSLCLTGLVFSLLFRLSFVISAIIAMRCLVQFIGQAVGVMLLRKRWDAARFPFKMWLYPVPAVAAIAGWALIFASTHWLALAAVGIIGVGAGVFLIRARMRREWPFESSASTVHG